MGVMEVVLVRLTWLDFACHWAWLLSWPTPCVKFQLCSGLGFGDERVGSRLMVGEWKIGIILRSVGSWSMATSMFG